MAKNRWKSQRGRDLPIIDDFPFTDQEAELPLVEESLELPNAPDETSELIGNEEVTGVPQLELATTSMSTQNEDLLTNELSTSHVTNILSTRNAIANDTMLRQTENVGKMTLSEIVKDLNVEMDVEGVAEINVAENTPHIQDETAQLNTNRIIIQAEIPNQQDGGSQIINIQIQPLIGQAANESENLLIDTNKQTENPILTISEEAPADMEKQAENTAIDITQNAVINTEEVNTAPNIEEENPVTIIEDETVDPIETCHERSEVQTASEETGNVSNDEDQPLSKIFKVSKMVTRAKRRAPIRFVDVNEIAKPKEDVATNTIKKVKKVTIMRKHKCKFCACHYKDANKLGRHYTFAHAASFLKCSRCLQYFVDRSAKQTHEARHALKNGMMVKCSKCPIVFKDLSKMAAHETKEHASISDGLCVATLADLISIHLKMDINNFVDSKNSEYICICNQTFKTKNKYINHLNKCSIDNYFVCTHCAKVFPRKNALRRHMTLSKCDCTACKQKATFRCKVLVKHKCENCMREFRMLSVYRKHASMCTSSERLCRQCDMKFSTLEELVQHSKEHEGQLETMTCKYCQKVFIGGEAMGKHIGRHLQDFEKCKYKCSQCEIAFRYPKKLFNHFRSHPDLLPYICKICDEKYSSHVLFKKHITVTHRGTGLIKFDENHYVTFEDKPDSEDQANKEPTEASVNTNEGNDQAVEMTGEANLSSDQANDHEILDQTEEIEQANDITVIGTEDQKDDYIKNPFQCLMCTDNFYGFESLQYHMISNHSAAERSEQQRTTPVVHANSKSKIRPVQLVVEYDASFDPEVLITCPSQRYEKKLAIINDIHALKIVNRKQKQFRIASKKIDVRDEGMILKRTVKLPEKIVQEVDDTTVKCVFRLLPPGCALKSKFNITSERISETN